MEWMERMNLAVDELERSLTGEVDYARLARTACCSVYHFQRMFAYLADLPLSEYVRRRRMSRAAVDLRAGMKVIDVAHRVHPRVSGGARRPAFPGPGRRRAGQGLSAHRPARDGAGQGPAGIPAGIARRVSRRRHQRAA